MYNEGDKLTCTNLLVKILGEKEEISIGLEFFSLSLRRINYIFCRDKSLNVATQRNTWLNSKWLGIFTQHKNICFVCLFLGFAFQNPHSMLQIHLPVFKMWVCYKTYRLKANFHYTNKASVNTGVALMFIRSNISDMRYMFSKCADDNKLEVTR